MDDGKITSEIYYQFLILKILVDSGGTVETNRVMEIIKRDFKHTLSGKDLAEYEVSKEGRWKNYVRFARQHLKESGYLRKDSPRGVWEITAESRGKYNEWFKFLQENLPQNKDNT